MRTRWAPCRMPRRGSHARCCSGRCQALVEADTDLDDLQPPARLRKGSLPGAERVRTDGGAQMPDAAVTEYDQILHRGTHTAGDIEFHGDPLDGAPSMGRVGVQEDHGCGLRKLTELTVVRRADQQPVEPARVALLHPELTTTARSCRPASSCAPASTRAKNGPRMSVTAGRISPVRPSRSWRPTACGWWPSVRAGVARPLTSGIGDAVGATRLGEDHRDRGLRDTCQVSHIAPRGAAALSRLHRSGAGVRRRRGGRRTARRRRRPGRPRPGRPPRRSARRSGQRCASACWRPAR